MEIYSVREAKPEEQRELTRLCVRATMRAGYDEAFIDRSMPSLTITLPLISGDFVRVAQDGSGEVTGVACVTPKSWHIRTPAAGGIGRDKPDRRMNSAPGRSDEKG